MACMRKVLLVHPPNDIRYRRLRTGYVSFPPPSGLEILAACIQKHFPMTEIQVFDGSTQSIQEIGKSLYGDLVGISDWFTSHRTAVRLAEIAKRNNPKCQVVLGGPNASNLAARILRRHYEVDYIVHGDGETAIVGLLEGRPVDTIRNLWHRNALGEPVFTGQICTSLDSLPLFDFRHLVKPDLNKYCRRFSSDHDLGLTPVPISSMRGCLKAEKQGPCAYCSMPGSKFRLLNPHRAWEQIAHLHTQYGIDYFFETGDSFAVGDYPEQFLKARPAGLKVRFRNYANPDSLNPENIRIFRELGVEEVFIGIESIDPTVLEKANKMYDTGVIEQTIALLENNGIRVFLPFLFGLPGETASSVRESFAFARYLVHKYKIIQRVLFSLAIPLVGTSWFTKLVRNSDVLREYDQNGVRSLREDDDIEYERLCLLSLKHYCQTNFWDIYFVLKASIEDLPRERIAGFGGVEENIVKCASELVYCS